jgi:hypothetical protein
MLPLVVIIPASYSGVLGSGIVGTHCYARMTLRTLVQQWPIDIVPQQWEQRSFLKHIVVQQ